MTLYWQFYTDDGIYNEEVKEVHKEWLTDVLSRLTSAKALWLQRDSGESVNLIQRGYFNLAIYNHQKEFFDWAHGETDEFPPVVEEEEIAEDV